MRLGESSTQPFSVGFTNLLFSLLLRVSGDRFSYLETLPKFLYDILIFYSCLVVRVIDTSFNFVVTKVKVGTQTSRGLSGATVMGDTFFTQETIHKSSRKDKKKSIKQSKGGEEDLVIIFEGVLVQFPCCPFISFKVLCQI